MKTYISICITIILFSIITISPTKAEIFEVQIPSMNWSIQFDAPTFLSYKGGLKDTSNYDFIFFGFAKNGFNISIFVESIKSDDKGHKECFEYYWSKVDRSPKIDEASIEIKEYSKFYKVEYIIEGEDQGKNYEMSHANYYFEYQQKWVDVHISIMPDIKEFDNIFNNFTNSLKYGSNL